MDTNTFLALVGFSFIIAFLLSYVENRSERDRIRIFEKATQDHINSLIDHLVEDEEEEEIQLESGSEEMVFMM